MPNPLEILLGYNPGDSLSNLGDAVEDFLVQIAYTEAVDDKKNIKDGLKNLKKIPSDLYGALKLTIDSIHGSYANALGTDWLSMSPENRAERAQEILREYFYESDKETICEKARRIDSEEED